MDGPLGSLNAAQRRRDVDALASGREIDLLVIGGGVTGAGVALDAAARGLSVTLVERRDLASGTSRQSSKLIHGGLRYLRQAEVGLAWESARERHILMSRTAPHLVRPLPFLAPLNDSLGRVMGVATESAIRFGDLLRRMAGSSYAELPGTHRISKEAALALAPSLRQEHLRGAVQFWDGQAVDDARIVICLARTAAAHGARIVTYCAAKSVHGGNVSLHDEINGSDFTVRARAVVNACGVWAGELSENVTLRPSKGVHLILSAEKLGNPRAAVLTPVPGEQARWVGCTPVGDGRVIVGVTDDAYSGAIDYEPAVTPGERRFLLNVLSQAIDTEIAETDVIGEYAGFRPLLDTGGGSTADISRRHALIESDDGSMITVVGGKFTTYRQMAADAVDRICEKLGRRLACPTADLPLLGAASRDELIAIRLPRHLLYRYGTDARFVAEYAVGDAELLRPVAPGVPFCGAELLFGLHHEGAMTLDDVLDRRVRLGPVPAQRAAALAYAEKLVEKVAA